MWGGRTRAPSLHPSAGPLPDEADHETGGPGLNFDLADPRLLQEYLHRLLDEHAKPVAPEIDPRVYTHRGFYFDRLPDRAWTAGPFNDLLSLYERRGAETEEQDDGSTLVTWSGMRLVVTAAGRLRTEQEHSTAPQVSTSDAPPALRLVVHADWSLHAGKRWMCIAERDHGGRFAIEDPVPCGDTSTLVERLLDRADGGHVLVGFDFPIGLPAAWAEHAGVESFSEVLPRLGSGRWAQFFDVAEHPDEISVERPFYPMRPGGTSQAQLLERLAFESKADLLRACDARTPTRGPASPIFWTLGAKQVGKAALTGWREVVVPALQKMEHGVGVWPFDGELSDLVSSRRLTIAETYPAEACIHLGMTAPGTHWKKTTQEGRGSQAAAMLDWAEARGVHLQSSLVERIQDGFGPASDGEDPFDAVIGLLSMLEVAEGHRPEGAPDEPAVRLVEGWILGQESVVADKGTARLGL